MTSPLSPNPEPQGAGGDIPFSAELPKDFGRLLCRVASCGERLARDGSAGYWMHCYGQGTGHFVESIRDNLKQLQSIVEALSQSNGAEHGR